MTKVQKYEKQFTYEDLFKAFIAGDTESMRTGDDVDREEFEEWFKKWFEKTCWQCQSLDNFK